MDIYLAVAAIGTVASAAVAFLAACSDPNGQASPPLYAAKGAFIGALLFGGGSMLVAHFLEAADPVTIEDCLKSAPASTNRVELKTGPDGKPACDYGSTIPLQP